MKAFRAVRNPGIFRGKESGVGLLETLVALALLGIIAASFLGGLATASRAAFTADEHATAESLARSQMEYV
ncbi:MAG: type II secretion system protein, partial [Chloroflexota bacterium]|nr:type II secretion system protein [Chloroflexota bacterium]